jgi:hypothetical protein
MQHQDSAEELDSYGSKALALFLNKYRRISVADACMQTQDGLKSENLTVWANRTGQWEIVPVPKEWNKTPTRSLCREVVTEVFGLSDEQYEAIRDALDDVGSNDRMGIYRHKGNPQEYAIVLRLPNRDKFETLKLGAMAGAGIGLGVLGKMFSNQGAQRDTWFEAVKNFMLYSQAFEQNYSELKDMLLTEEEKMELVKWIPDPPQVVTEALKSKIFAWEYNNFSGASEDKYQAIANSINVPVPKTASYIANRRSLITHVFENVYSYLYSQALAEAQDQHGNNINADDLNITAADVKKHVSKTNLLPKYLSRLTTPPQPEVDEQQRIIELQSIVKETALAIQEQYQILEETEAWIKPP